MTDCGCSGQPNSVASPQATPARIIHESPAEKRARARGKIASIDNSPAVSSLHGQSSRASTPINRSRAAVPLRPVTPVRRPDSTTWAYGVTTVPQRRETLLPRTLASLSAAGFPSPRLFVDGCDDPSLYTGFGLPATLRPPPNVRTVGNWILSLWELYIRDPHADFYAIFQDDFVTYRNLRQYLERCPHPSSGYLNLYTFPTNQSLEQDAARAGWFKSNQRGFGAVGLIFSRQAACTLLQSEKLVMRPQDPVKGWRLIDMCIASAMTSAGYNEYVHNPSLVQHTGRESSMGNSKHPLANSFRGEDFDAVSLLGE